MVREQLIELALEMGKVLAAMVLSAGAIYSGMGALDRLTSGIDEWKEVKKGNLAIGAVLVSVMAATLLLVEPRVRELVFAVSLDLPALFVLKLLIVSLLNYVLGLLAAIFVVFLTINLVDRLTRDIDEFSELKKGNLAVGLILASSILLVAFAVKPSFESAFEALQAMESLLV